MMTPFNEFYTLDIKTLKDEIRMDVIYTFDIVIIQFKKKYEQKYSLFQLMNNFKILKESPDLFSEIIKSKPTNINFKHNSAELIWSYAGVDIKVNVLEKIQCNRVNESALGPHLKILTACLF